jgi:hypothetical protein
MSNQSWYQQNIKKLNVLTGRLIRYNLQGSFDQELDLKEILDVMQNLAQEISSLQTEVQEKNKLIGLLQVEIQKIKTDNEANKDY